MDNIDHGTYRGYQRCVKRPEGSCADCKKATAEYSRMYRKKNPDFREKDYTQDKLRRKALNILRDRHRAEYCDIINELKRELRNARS